MWIHLGLLFVCTWVLPFCVGVLPVRIMKEEHRSFGMIWVSGWFMMFAVFQVLVVPFIVTEQSFSLAVRTYSIVISAIAVVSVVIGRRALKKSMDNLKDDHIENGQLPVMILVLVLIAVQLAGAFFLQYLDGDDAFYVATSLTSEHTDTMYRFTPYYGANGELDIRHALSPVPIFMAWLARVSGIHVTILCHSYISMLFLLLMYMIYFQMAKRLFANQKKNQWLFLLTLSIWYLFGNVSIYAAESFAFTRTWQGKSMFPNLIIPYLFRWMFCMAKDEMDIGEWAMLFVTTLAATFTTSTGIFTVPILLGMEALIIAVVKKRAMVVVQTVACLVPCLFFGMLYLFLK
ncbi:MAG: DUF6077 domain-containing protein [Lachnospiraceae bacterium]|nr:DUF6077 domain-containing protein [Lachnospiraceae bacterium]